MIVKGVDISQNCGLCKWWHYKRHYDDVNVGSCDIYEFARVAHDDGQDCLEYEFFGEQ
jgi:hypothetical protein|tara:strand:+ start:1905 stop:2078 length:174 start_codon:yes stop_codon:yes gene_type:complete